MFGHKMKRIGIVLMLIMPCIAFSEHKAQLTPTTPFKRLEMTNNTILAHMPDSGNRWILKNGTNREGTTYSQVLCLKNGDEIELIERHTQFTFRTEITNGCGFLHYKWIFDARSFGDDITTTRGTLKVGKD
jgi:hypothetical protein